MFLDPLSLSHVQTGREAVEFYGKIYCKMMTTVCLVYVIFGYDFDTDYIIY